MACCRLCPLQSVCKSLILVSIQIILYHKLAFGLMPADAADQFHKSWTSMEGYPDFLTLADMATLIWCFLTVGYQILTSS